jgi:DNA (cytosine-5)-methyltransferase 1
MVDNDPVSVATLMENSWTHDDAIALLADVIALSGAEVRERADLRSSDPLIVIGGPPCQPFSKAAYWTDPGDDARYRRARAIGETLPKPSPITTPSPDIRRSLLDEYWRLVMETKADAFLLENVVSILHPRNRSVISALLAAAADVGFRTTLVRANAADYGVPQNRRRIFVLGSRGSEPSAPTPTHGTDTGQGFRSSGEALIGFSGDEYFEEAEVVRGKWARHLAEVPPGSNYKHHTAWAGHPRPSFVAETRYWNFLLKLHPGRPSWTVAANPGPWTGPFHWNSRRLRIPELAALQCFPEGYRFVGSRRDCVRQIGNAVPPPLASAMVRAVIDTLQSERVAA